MPWIDRRERVLDGLLPDTISVTKDLVEKSQSKLLREIKDDCNKINTDKSWVTESEEIPESK